jgi:hypothetical protein
MALKYLGTDPRTEWVPGIPARDLSDADIKELGLDESALAESRLYEKTTAKKTGGAD